MLSTSWLWRHVPLHLRRLPTIIDSLPIYKPNKMPKCLVTVHKSHLRETFCEPKQNWALALLQEVFTASIQLSKNLTWTESQLCSARPPKNCLGAKKRQKKDSRNLLCQVRGPSRARTSPCWTISQVQLVNNPMGYLFAQVSSPMDVLVRRLGPKTFSNQCL